MAQKALILDELLLDTISSGRCLVVGRESLIALDNKMRLLGFMWSEHQNRYIKVEFGPPPIRKHHKFI
jgi:hypothetical protein